MLFKVEHGKDIFQLNPELKAIEEFERLTARQMTYVALYADYTGPFRKLPKEERKYQAALTAGYNLEKDGKRLDANARNLVAGKVGAVEAGIKKYIEMQPDDRETYDGLCVLIHQITELNIKPDKTVVELEKAVAISTGKLDKLVETKKKLEALLDVREDYQAEVQNEQGIIDPNDPELVDESSLSLLDKVNAGLI